MNKPKIFLDWDGLKFDTIPAHIEWINHFYGINSSVEEYINLGGGSWTQVINKHKPELALVKETLYLDLADNFLNSLEWHSNVMPFDGMCAIVPQLAKKYELIVVTARQKVSEPLILHFSEKYVPGCVTHIHCVHEHMGGNVFQRVSKRDFILGSHGEKIAFIDDSPHEIDGVRDIIPSYLFDPTGRHTENMDIPNKVSSWAQIGEIFL